MKTFLTFRIINTETFLYVQKNSDTETLAKYPVYNTDFVLLHCLVREKNIIVEDTAPIRLLQSPRALSVYILITFIKNWIIGICNTGALIGLQLWYMSHTMMLSKYGNYTRLLKIKNKLKNSW